MLLGLHARLHCKYEAVPIVDTEGANSPTRPEVLHALGRWCYSILGSSRVASGSRMAGHEHHYQPGVSG